LLVQKTYRSLFPDNPENDGCLQTNAQRDDVKSGCSVLKLSQVKFSKDLDLCFLHTRHIEYGCMCRKFKKVGNHHSRESYIMMWQSSLLSPWHTAQVVTSGVQRRSAEPARPMEKITQARRVTRPRPRHSIGLSQDVIVLK